MNCDQKRSKHRALVVVAKAPLEGLVKTRLCECLTAADAAALYECLLDDIVAKFAGQEQSDFWLAFAPGGEAYFTQNYPAVRLLPQRGEHLGERLHHIFVDLSCSGYSEIIVADSDSPSVPLSSVSQAFEQLVEGGCDLVLGPADDGGYYLVGLKDPVEGIFLDIPWSTDRVLDSTLARARDLMMKVGLLPRAYDIDVEADLRRLWNDFGRFEELRALAPRTFDYLRSLTDNGSLPPIRALASSRVKRAQNVRKP